jgi:hypothetical protein
MARSWASGWAIVVAQDDELVAAEPGEGVALTYAVAQPLGDLDEHGNARAVPEAGVDLLP